MAIEEWREPANEEQLRDLSSTILNDPLDSDRTKDTPFRTDTNCSEQCLVTENGNKRAEHSFSELENVVSFVAGCMRFEMYNKF